MTQQEVIQKFITALSNSKAITGSVAVNEAFNEAFGKRFSTMQEAIDAFLRDCKAAKNTDDFLRNYCGIILDNEDNGSITGLDVGGTKIKTDESIVPENTSPTDLVELYRNADIPDTLTKEILLDPSKDPDLRIVPNGITNGSITEQFISQDLQFTKKGLTVTVPNYNGIIESAESGDDEANRKLIVINGLYSWWIEGALQLIKDSYGDEFSLENDKQSITVHLKNDGNNGTPAAVNFLGFNLDVNMYYLSQIKNDDYNGQLSMESESSPGEYVNVPGEYLDNLLAHELTHAVMQAKFGLWGRFVKWSSLPKVIIEGTAELTRGVDKIREDMMSKSIEEHRKNNYLTDILDYDNRYENDIIAHPIKVFFDKDDADSRNSAKYAASYMLLRYFAKQCATEESPATTLGANQSITCTLEEGLLVKANNGIAALQKGDALVTDGYGNIATIKIGNENNIISTPESKSMVVVKDHNNEDIASIFGSASVHDSGLVYKNFSDIDVSSELDNVSITGGDGDDVILVKANNASISAKDGNNKITVNGDSANVYGGSGNDTVKITGDGANIDAGAGNDEVVIYGNNSPSISGGAGNNLIFVGGDKNTVDSTTYGNDTITVKGSGNYLKSAPNDVDKFIITNQAKNNTIIGFNDGYDEILFETGDIAAKVKIFNGSDESVVIYSTQTGDTLVVLEYVTSGSNDNIVYSTDDGNTVRTSIDWLLANTTPINPNPDDTEVIDVPVNGNVNNTRDNVIINAVSGNNIVQNSGNNVIITGGIDKDEVSNNANNVTIDGKDGNDILSNGSAGSFPITHVRQSFDGGDFVIINGGIGADLIYNYVGANVQLRGGEDNDTIGNSGNNVQITGDSGNDEINNNGGDTVTIDGGDGKDTLFSSGKAVSVHGGNGEDSIRINASGANVTAEGGNDDDDISNYGSNALIDGGSGNDYLYNRGTDSTINGGIGNDSISNLEGTRVLLYGDEDNDEIRNGAENVTIDGGSGDDSIDNNAANVSIFGGDGKDTITHRNGQANNVTIDGGAGDDSISNLVASNILINGGDDNDSINNRGNNVTINSGSGNDSIVNNGEHVTIEGAEGDDTINNSRKEVSMNGGSGADFIDNGHDASNVTIDGGADNDTIANESSNVKIVGDSGNDSIYNKNNSYVTIDSGSDDDFITNSTGLNASINAGDGNDTIDNSAHSDSVTINTGAGKDSIFNSGDKNIIFGETGEDEIYNYGDNTTINGGADNDSIYNGSFTTSGNLYNLENGSLLGVAYNVSLIGGDGDDYIANTAGYVTIEAGEGNDSISLIEDSGTWIHYAEGDGSDTIWGFNENTWLKIGDGTGTYSNSTINNDIVIKVGDGSIILIDAKGINLKIWGKQSYDTTPPDTTPPDTTPPDTTPPDTIPPDTTPPDTIPSEQDQPNTVQIIKENTGIDITRLDSIVLTHSDSIEEAISGGSKLLNISSDNGVMDVDLRDSDYRQIVSLGGGTQNVQFNDENGNVAIVGESATGAKNIIFGNGDDLGIFYSSDADIRATVGSGRDSILIDNNACVRVDMSNADNATIVPYSGNVTLDGCNSDRTNILLPDVDDIIGAIKENSIQLSGDEMRTDSARVKFNDSSIINLIASDGSQQKVGFSGANHNFIDTHEIRGDFLLKGNYAENSSDKQSSKRSTLISGSGNDTILAGARDFVDGGNGRNQVFLTPYDLRQIEDGTTIASSGNGRNTVYGFHEGFGYDSDVIQVNDFNNFKFKFDTDGLLLTANDSRLKFDGIGIASATTDDSTNSLGTGKAELIQITNGSSTMRAAVAQTDQSILVQKDDYFSPSAFFGNRSGLNFSDYHGDLNINLDDGTGTLGKVNATFQGINKLQAGTGMATLIGSDNRDTLIAGDGYSSLWGGKGNDKLIGRAGSTDKDGRTTFFFFAGDGHDVICDFNFLTPQNYYSGDTDKINIGDCDINDAYCSGDDVVLALDDDSYLTIKDAKEKNFQINHMIAQVGNELHYDGIANTFVNNGNSSSSLIVDSGVCSAEIWLDNSHNTQFFGTIRTLDASAVEGNTSLVGNEYDNTIIAGQSDSSLWGGFSSSNDLLIGGNSRNTFFYCMGNGNDTIQAATDKDAVILSDVFLDQIVSTNISADFVDINFIDGGSLRINGNYNVTYQLADGSRYSANHERLEWDSR